MMQEGDIVAVKASQNGFGIVKILRIETLSDGTLTYHCLSYATVGQIPSLEQVAALAVIVWHSPIAGNSIERDGTLIGNLSISAEEMIGFHEYLKHTDFARYAKETGFDPDVQLPLAQQFYEQGNQLGEQQRREEAIEAYSHALDIFPIFMEALDNRGLTRMELGKYQEAIKDFERSLAAHGLNPVPLCSLGECYLKLGEYAAAERAFVTCSEQWPQEPRFMKFVRKAQSLRTLHDVSQMGRKEAPPKKPWWRIW